VQCGRAEKVGYRLQRQRYIEATKRNMYRVQVQSGAITPELLGNFGGRGVCGSAAVREERREKRSRRETGNRGVWGVVEVYVRKRERRVREQGQQKEASYTEGRQQIMTG
jgi:hypothetical protein